MLYNILVRLVLASTYGIPVVLVLCAVVKMVRSKKMNAKPVGHSFWWLVTISSIGSLLVPFWSDRFFGEFTRADLHYFGEWAWRLAMSLSDFFEFATLLLVCAFFVSAMAVLCEKRSLCIIGTLLLSLGVLLLAYLRLYGNLWYYGVIGFRYHIDLVFCALISLALTVAVVWQCKARKAFSQVLYMALLGICLAAACFQPMCFGFYWSCMALIAMFFWLSPKSEKKITLPKIELPKMRDISAKPKVSPADTADKLKALETLQGLLNNGAITKEEFDAKKKQLLGL